MTQSVIPKTDVKTSINNNLNFPYFSSKMSTSISETNMNEIQIIMSKDEFESVIAETMEKTMSQITTQSMTKNKEIVDEENNEKSVVKQRDTTREKTCDKYLDFDRNYEYNDTEYALSYFSLITALIFCNPFVNSCFFCKFNKSRDPRVRRYNCWLLILMIISWITLCLIILAALLTAFFVEK